MLDKLILHNFQSHKHSELDFDPGVNVIVGPSDSGKTALIRALRWLVWGRPLGDSFISHWSDNCHIQLNTDGHIIVKNKERKGGGEYIVDGSILSAVRADVPTEVAQRLRLGDINLQQQLDRPFLLDSSPGEVAQHFNKVAKMDVIDTVTKNILLWLKRISSDIASSESQISSLESSLGKYVGLEEKEAKITILEGLQASLSSKQEGRSIISELCEQIGKTTKLMEEQEKIAKLESKVTKVFSLISEKEGKATELEALSFLFQRVVKSEEEIEKLSSILSIEPKTESLLSLFSDVKTKKAERGVFYRLVSDASMAVERLSLEEGELSTLEKKFHDNFPEVCPLCGQKVGR